MRMHTSSMRAYVESMLMHTHPKTLTQKYHNKIEQKLKKKQTNMLKIIKQRKPKLNKHII